MKKSDDFHRVCLLQLHVKGRPPRPAVRTGGNRETKANILWLDSGAVTEWERLTAAAQDANRRWTRWLRKALGTHFLPKPFLVEAGRRMLPRFHRKEEIKPRVE